MSELALEAWEKCGDFNAPHLNACEQGLPYLWSECAVTCCSTRYLLYSWVLLRRGVIPCMDICLKSKIFSLSGLQTLFGIVLPKENRSKCDVFHRLSWYQYPSAVHSQVASLNVTSRLDVLMHCLQRNCRCFLLCSLTGRFGLVNQWLLLPRLDSVGVCR